MAAKWASVLAHTVPVFVVALCVTACASAPVTKFRGHQSQGPRARTLFAVRPTTSAAASTTTTLPPLAVVKVVPENNARKVGPRTPVVITYNRPPGGGVSYPTILPITAGRWLRSGPTQLMFKPAGDWQPATTYRVSVPLSRTKTAAAKFTTRLPSTLVLQQYLAMLGYLPLRFTPSGDVANRKAVLKREPTSPNLVPQVESAGAFTWAYPRVPTSLWAQWHRGRPNVVTSAVVMRFEIAEGLAPDGDAGPLVWHALLRAIAKRQMDTSPYNYVIVSESLPETLSAWQDGGFVFKTFTNTGVPGAATPQGTWPVAYKQNPNLMKGCDPNGPCYSVWVAYARCAEVPPWQGATVYGYEPVGTLVTVTT